MLEALSNLPARGLPVSCEAVATTTYIATHDTQPPPHQIVQTDQSTTALLRLIRKAKAGAQAAAGTQKGAPRKTTDDALKGKRTAEATDERPNKKPNTAGPNTAGAAAPAGTQAKRLPALTADELKSRTIPQLQELLRERTLPVSGRKEELIRRLIDHGRAAKLAGAGAKA